MCRVFAVSPSGYYAWNSRAPSARALRDAELTAQIRAFHARSKGTYGAPRVLEDLREQGIRLGKKRVHARQVSARGGELFCELAEGRVHMGGRAVLYLEGWITV